MCNFNARSSLAGYIALAGIWLILGSLFVWCEIVKPASGCWKGAMVSFTGAALWIIWLRGFRLKITNGAFEYRNGFYQTRSCLLADIQSYETKWLDWKILSRYLRVLRGVIGVRGQEPIFISLKPFSRADIAILRSIGSKIKDRGQN
jgi:hypothetical protein